MSNRKAIAYIRVSTLEQAREGVSLDAQEDRVITYCSFQGLPLIAVIRDEGISASKELKTREGGKELLEKIKSEKITDIVALKLDRLFRNSIDALTNTAIWDKAGISLHLVDMGGQTLNTATAMGRFFLSMMSAFAELERNMISERTKTALNHMKKNGQVFNHIPYGFLISNDMLIEDSSEQIAIQMIKELRSNNFSLRDIATTLTEKGVRTKNEAKWHPSTVSNILKANQIM